MPKNGSFFLRILVSSLSLDETILSDDELYTILTNKQAKGKKGCLVAMIKGTKAEDIQTKRSIRSYAYFKDDIQ